MIKIIFKKYISYSTDPLALDTIVMRKITISVFHCIYIRHSSNTDFSNRNVEIFNVYTQYQFIIAWQPNSLIYSVWNVEVREYL